MNLINRVGLNNDDTGFVEYYDFSKANSSEQSRVEAVSTVASVCYGNEEKPNFKIYDKLLNESLGLPSSSFEFVPVLLNGNAIDEIMFSQSQLIGLPDVRPNVIPNVVKFGQPIYLEESMYILTNLRALLEDYSTLKGFLSYDIREIYNSSEEEQKIIKENFHVFKTKSTIRTIRQLVRHRSASFQELSRRYTSADKAPLEFYSESSCKPFDTERTAVKRYNELISLGQPKEEARDVLPVSLYSTIWMAWQPEGLQTFLDLRVKKSAQKQIRELAEGMKSLLRLDEKQKENNEKTGNN